MSYFVYIVKCADDTLYTGITNDISKRISAHNSGTTGAKYTRARRPVVLVYSEACQSKSDALRREVAVKQMTRREKIELINATATKSDRSI